MADDPDLDQLAKQYLDLWQEHLRGLADNPQTAETMTQFASQMTAQLGGMMAGPAAAFAALAQQAMQPRPPSAATQPPTERDDAAERDTADTPAGPQAAGPAHGDSDVDLAGIARRLDRIERRLAALEAGPAGGSGKGGGTAKKGPGRRRS